MPYINYLLRCIAVLFVSEPWRWWRYRTRCRHIDGGEIGRTDNFQIFHVGRIVEQEMHDAGALVYAVAGFHQRHLILIHEAGPAFEHDDDVKVGFMPVPAG